MNASTTVAISLEALAARMERLDTIPSVPAILLPLLRYLDVPIEDVDVPKVVDLVSHDKSLAAQCLHMANSPLFGRWHNIDTVRGAVVALGISRVRDIAMSCCVLKLLPNDRTCVDPRVFWEHSLGVALVSRRLARRVGFRDPEKAYLAGLLHDLGIVANLLLLPDEFDEVAHHSFAQHLPFDAAESKLIGLTHSVTGALLAEHWQLAPDLSEVIRRHHDVQNASLYRGLVALVHIGDLICRHCGLGYGFSEQPAQDIASAPAWAILAEECPAVRRFGADRFIGELDMYVSEVRRLVAVLFRLDNN
ncbi:MAG TPA: HDOD domain-containing protein [Terriglobales bacterium]|nr:HDOD domain-containing protein [Terriglobales bacterium]